MELEKSEHTDVLGSLYTLRGGLSAISVEYDKARQIDNDYYEQLNRVADQAGGARHEAPKGTVKYGSWLMDGGFENELKRRFYSIQKVKIADYSYEYKEEINKNNKHSTKHIIFAVISLTLIICIVAFGGILFGGKALEGPLDYVTLIALILIPLALFITAIVMLRKAALKKRELNKYTDSLTKEKENENRRFENNRNSAQANLDKLPIVRENALKVLNSRNDTLKPIIQSCDVYYKALLQQFSPLLDERDWQHLDLIIYELETRRADSVKEALQLVDRELQTERIERTIGEATKAICYTLQRGFTVLQQSIEVCCNKICDRLDTISSQLDTMSMQMAVQSMQLAGISGQLADLTDSVNVSNALQAKANVTSAQLCSDVHAMRYYS